jgi:hypothetical protein
MKTNILKSHQIEEEKKKSDKNGLVAWQAKATAH